MDGWIRWYRKGEDNPVLKCDYFDKMHAWIWLVEHANYKKTTIRFNGEYKTLKRGQLWTSIRKLSTTWGWGKEKVSAFLNLLEANGMIKQYRDTDGTLLTIEKYSTFQNPRDTNLDTPDTNRDTNGTPSSIEKYSVDGIPQDTNPDTDSPQINKLNKAVADSRSALRSLRREDEGDGDPRYIHNRPMGPPDVW